MGEVTIAFIWPWQMGDLGQKDWCDCERCVRAHVNLYWHVVVRSSVESIEDIL